MRKKLEEMADIQTGYQFREKLDVVSVGKYQVVQAKDISQSENHRLDPVNLYRVTPKRDTKKHEIRNGDVIFMSKGRRNYATFVDGLFGVPQTIAAGYFFLLRIKSKSVLPKYLTWAINQSPSQGYLQRIARGSGMPFIPKQAFKNLEIEVPPVKIQRLIIKLDELSQKERTLLNYMEQKRSELIRGICLRVAKQN